MSESRAMAFGRDAESLAEVLGNRAGVVEWANAAFEQLTGIPLADTVDKPVTRFLERAGLDLEVVDFVAQHFFEGRPCRLEFPFERPDGRRIDVLLEVEALRDALGEIDRFRATACERSEPAADRHAPPRSRRAEPSTTTSTTPSTTPASSPRSKPALPMIRLAPAIHRALAPAPAEAGHALPPSPDAWLLDLALSPEPLAIHASASALEGLVASLVRAARASLVLADHAWGTLTLTTGRTTPHRRFISKVHAIPASAPALADTSQVHLELHDTGAPIDAAVLARLRRLAASIPDLAPDLDSAAAAATESRSDATAQCVDDHGDASHCGADAREDALVEAIQRAHRLGASIHLDSTPGCGNQVLVLFPD